MNCSKPLYIPYPGMPDRPSMRVPGLDKPYMHDYMCVPCGKCMACVEKRQKDFAFRIRMEAEKRGTMVFLTLTYNNEHLPLVHTLWRCSKVSGELERISDPEFVCYSGREDFLNDRKDMAEVHPSKLPRYVDHDLFEDEDWKYFTRITPSVCRKDVQGWLKRCRVHFERKLGRKLDFSYSICSEYGERYCRPHYHCCLLGVSEDDANIMASLWNYGFYKLDFVHRVNKDNSDGFGKVANYVAKYISKGDFECQSVKDCTAKSCRQMNSKGLGNYIVERFMPFALAFDMVGKYDPDTFWNHDKARYLSRLEISQLIAEVPKRLAVSFDGKYYFAFPRVIRNKIFYVEKESLTQTGEKVKYLRPSKLWKMVVDSLQSEYAELDRRQFAGLLTNKSPREIAEAVASFNLSSDLLAETANNARKEDYKSRLQNSVF